MTNQLTVEYPITAEQRQCDEDTGHDWRHYAYEYDTNSGGYSECKLCGFQRAYDDYSEDDFDDL